MGLTGQGSNRDLSERLGRVRSEIQSLAAETVPGGASKERMRKPWAQVSTAIQSVLSSAGELRARDIHAAVEKVLGEDVSVSSVKNCLATHSRGTDQMFVRTGRGRYRLT